MGSHSIDRLIPKKLDQAEIDKLLKKWQREDRYLNGHRDGYSGDWQTIPEIELHNKVFASTTEAMDYCLDNSEKWDNGVAVYIKVISLESKNKIDLKLKNDKFKLNNLIKAKDDLIEKSKQTLLKSGFAKCSNCLSRINVNMYGNINCPVCRVSLFKQSVLKSIMRLELKISVLSDKIEDKRRVLELKYSKKSKTHTLICGWAAS